MLSQKRERDAAKRFFQHALQTVGHAPERVITDGHRAYPRAIREIRGNDVLQRWNQYLTNRLEQDHRGIQQRDSPMRGFGRFTSASRFCRPFDEGRQFFRLRTAMTQPVSLRQQREMVRQRLAALQALVQAAS